MVSQNGAPARCPSSHALCVLFPHRSTGHAGPLPPDWTLAWRRRLGAFQCHRAAQPGFWAVAKHGAGPAGRQAAPHGWAVARGKAAAAR